METWQEVTIRVNREAEEVVSNLLIELGSQGVAIADSAGARRPLWRDFPRSGAK